MPSPKTYPATCCSVGLLRRRTARRNSPPLRRALPSPRTRVCAPTSTASAPKKPSTWSPATASAYRFPPEMYGPLTSVARAFADRKDVCVVRQDRLMTTQEAADYWAYPARPLSACWSAEIFRSSALTRTVALL